jgi:RNA polymerase sigma factor (sigma-70 family)
VRPVVRASDAEVDAALIRRIVEDRDREAFDALYGRYAAAAYGIALRVLRDPNMAEDVVQEVFLGLWKAPEAFNPGRGTLRGWLLTIVHHRSVDAVRHAVSRPAVQYDPLDDVGPPMEDTQDAALRRADADRVQRAIAALPAKQRQALLLAYWGGHTHAEIAGLTNVPIGTVKSRIFKGFQRLRAQLHSTDEGTPGGEQ